MARCNCANPPGGYIDCPDNCTPVCVIVDGKIQGLCIPKGAKMSTRELAKRVLREVAKKTGASLPATEAAYATAARTGVYYDSKTGADIRFNITASPISGLKKFGPILSKTQIAIVLADKVGLTQKQSSQYLQELATLAYKNAKNTFTLPGLGKLDIKYQAARKGRNPETGGAIYIPAKKVVKFKVAKSAKNAILRKK
jgi:DNA-binding protein HU-beta